MNFNISYHIWIFSASSFGRYCREIKNVSTQERVFIKNVITITKIVKTTGATSTALEKSFLWQDELKPGFGLSRYKNFLMH